MNCLYCGEECPVDQWDDNRCYKCQVCFSWGEKGFHILFSSDMNDKKYALNLFPDANLTVLVIITYIPGSYKAWDHYQEMNFQYIPNVTPQNVKDKIKTLLVFS